MLRLELRRGTAPATALVTAFVGTWLLAVHPDEWGGRWTMLATYLRVSLLVLIPLFVAAGAWQAGRERRSQIDELLGTTARPAWHPLLTAWAAVGLGGTVGLLGPTAVAAVLVGRVASYSGGGWWWIAAVGFVAMWTAAALGVAAGRLIPLRIVAPIVGLGTYVGLAIAVYFDRARWASLSPVIGSAGEADGWPIAYHAWQAGWLLALATTLLTVAARRWRAALVPGVLGAVLAVVPMAAGPAFGRPLPDRGATALVCTRSGPQVCVTQANAYLLDQVAAVAQPILARLSGIPGTPVRAVDYQARPPGASSTDTVWLPLTLRTTVAGRLARPRELGSDFTLILYDERCPVAAHDEGVFTTTQLAHEWLVGDPPMGTEPIARLRARSAAAQRVWFGEFLAATHRCDVDALRRLGESR